MGETPDNPVDKRVVIIGAGPAGLTAAYELTKLDVQPIVVEKYDKVGGLARTENHRGFRFDMGGHRFFTKAPEVNALWLEVLGEEFLRRPRSSRIFYQRKFFDYPITPVNALLGLGIWQAMLVVLSYIRWQLFPYRREDTYEQWVTNRFGERLFRTFFKTYTEKVWGIPCTELKAEWAAQRIKDLSLRSAVMNMFFTPKKTIKTLIDHFYYPRFGPGMMWNAFKSEIERRGGVVRVNSDVIRIHRTGARLDRVVVSSAGQRETIAGSSFISSMPITEFLRKLDPPAPARVLAAAANLKFRDFLTVCLIVNCPSLFPDNWIYIHDPTVKVGRIQNFKNWSPDMVPDRSKTSLGLEYFCTEGDDLWTMADNDLLELAIRELEQVGLANRRDVEDGRVFRVAKAYPVYDSEYRDHLAVVRDYVDSLANFQTIGRNGLHRYNNQDHAMLTGIMAVRNLMLGERNDLWSINGEQEYHEHIEEARKEPDRAFRELNRLALGLSLGAVVAGTLSVATILAMLGVGKSLASTLGLLGQYVPGFSISPSGTLAGLVFGFGSGFIGGWAFALLRNTIEFLTTAHIRDDVAGRVRRRLGEYG